MADSTDKALPSQGNEGARRRSRRGAPDLAALFEEVDSQAQSESLRSAGGDQGGGVAGLSSLRFVKPRPPGAGLLFDEITAGPAREAAEPAPPAPREGQLSPTGPGEESEEEFASRIPAALEHYLSPDLWRKLNSPEPARGVLINALERIRSVLYLVSTFLPANLVQDKMRRPFPGLVNGQVLRGTLLFSDVSGFTALSERLAGLGAEGAERLTAIMNQYFANMLEILAWSGGVLLKFAGDATLVYFPQQEDGSQARWAVRAGQRMSRAMAAYAQLETPLGSVKLQMKIGLATGDFLAASVGSAERMEYVVLGRAISQTMAAEGLTTAGGQLIANEATLACLEPGLALTGVGQGYSRLENVDQSALDDFEIKAETRRARGAIPWSASPQAIIAQVEVALRQVQALTPYLAPELVERLIVQARQRQVSSEFRPTTVIFLNFTGPETLLELWGESGAQRVTSLLNAYFTAMQEVVSRFGGMISRIDPYSKGTKMLVLFGAPVAHEDDPQRAVSAALAMNAELEALEANWRSRFSRHLPPDRTAPLIQHRIGITYGETFAGQVGSSTRREYTVMGDDVNLAARLMGAAEMGRILVGSRVQEVVEDYFVLTPLPVIRLKGKMKPVPVFQVEGPREDTLARRAHSRGPLIGRETELAQAGQILQSALAGQGTALTIYGPAGVGKSHLADALVNRAAAEGARVLFNLCRSFSAGVAYASWSRLLRSLAGITLLDYQPQVQYEKLRRLMEGLNVPVDHAAPLALVMGIDPAISRLAQAGEQARAASPVSTAAYFNFVKQGAIKRRGSQLDFWQQLDEEQSYEPGQRRQTALSQLSGRAQELAYAAVLELLTRLAGATPLVIFFEDAHWMDAKSRELFDYLCQRTCALPLFFLLARRGEEKDDTAQVGQALALESLSQAGTSNLVAHLLVSDLARVIHAQSRGNPLFIGEITRWFKRTHNLGAEELEQVLETSDILQQLVLGRLESLPEIQREIVKAASIVGYEFSTGEVQVLLASSIGTRSDDIVSLSNHLRALTREGLVVLTEAGADAHYAFQQTLVRDILYNSLPYEQRRDLHAKIADYLSTPPSSRRDIHARISLALGSPSAGDPVHEAETVAGHYELAQCWEKAARNLHIAGSQAYKQKAYDKAAQVYNRALEDLKKLPSEGLGSELASLHSNIYTGLGDLAISSGDYLSAVSALDAALASLPEDASPGLRWNLLGKLALVLPTQGRIADALKSLQDLLDKQPGATEAPSLVATLAWLLWRAGQPEAGQWRHKTLALVDAMPDAWAAGVKILMADLAEEWPAAVQGYASLGMSTGVALAALRQGDQSLAQGKPAAALDLYSQAVEAWRDAPQGTAGLSLALFRQADVYWRRNDLGATRQMLEQALEFLPQCAPALQPDGRAAIQRALKSLAEGEMKEWPVWRWQLYDDVFRIGLLFRP